MIIITWRATSNTDLCTDLPLLSTRAYTKALSISMNWDICQFTCKVVFNTSNGVVTYAATAPAIYIQCKCKYILTTILISDVVKVTAPPDKCTGIGNSASFKTMKNFKKKKKKQYKNTNQTKEKNLSYLSIDQQISSIVHTLQNKCQQTDHRQPNRHQNLYTNQSDPAQTISLKHIKSFFLLRTHLHHVSKLCAQPSQQCDMAWLLRSTSQMLRLLLFAFVDVV